MILTGAGERAFSAGADIGEFSASLRAGTGQALAHFIWRGQALTERAGSLSQAESSPR